MLSVGASAYIGFSTLAITGVSSEYMGSMFSYFREGLTIGQAFLTVKQQVQSYYSVSGLLMDQGEALQLYGDPTLQYP